MHASVRKKKTRENVSTLNMHLGGKWHREKDGEKAKRQSREKLICNKLFYCVQVCIAFLSFSTIRVRRCV